MTMALLIAAFLMGFFGSPHCLGMCGGIVTAFGLSMKETSPAKKRGLVATYHLGRLLSYALLGLIAGVIGTKVLTPLMVGNSTPRILLGLVLVFVGLTMLGLPFLNKLERLGMHFWQALSPLRQKVFPLNTFPRALTAGLLWGFLPCGLVYGALLIAVVGHDPLTGAVLMFVFGLGTVPMLVATHGTVNWMRNQIGRLRLRQVNGVIMMLSGLAVIAVPMIMANMHGGHGQMNHGQMNHEQMNHEQMNHEQMNHEQMNHEQMNHEQMNHEQMNHEQMNHEQMNHEQMNHEQMNHEQMNHEQMNHEQMNHEQMNHEQMNHEQMNHEQMNHEQMNHEQMNHEQMNHEQMNHEQMNHEQMNHD